jgi:heat shock protein HtpX
LANALKKLQAGVRQIPMTEGSPATAHMFIVNPFRGRDFAALFSTHPPMEKRIEKLESVRLS